MRKCQAINTNVIHFDVIYFDDIGYRIMRGNGCSIHPTESCRTTLRAIYARKIANIVLVVVKAGISKDIVLVGNLDRFEIWDSDRWAEENGKAELEIQREDAKEEIASIGL